MNNEAYYRIWWSPIKRYDRHVFSRLMPEIPGITGFFTEENNERSPILFLGCWQDGLRNLIKNFMDPLSIRYKELREDIEKQVEMEEVHVTYAVIETSPKDIQDILHYLIRTHHPSNNSRSYPSSGRYKNVYVEELQGEDFGGIGKNSPRRPL